jgi:hypothetical protein
MAEGESVRPLTVARYSRLGSSERDFEVSRNMRLHFILCPEFDSGKLKLRAQK